MFDCNKCANKNTCKENIKFADNLTKDIKGLKDKYKHFYGIIDVQCDYFIGTEKDIPCCCR